MKVRVRLACVCVALLLPGAFLVAWSLSAGPSMQIPASAMPAEVGAWSRVADERIDDAILELLGPSSYVARVYEAPDRSAIALYVGFYSGRVGQSKRPHDPEVCFPSAGWETTAVQTIGVPVPGGETLSARLLDTHLGRSRQLVLYWFQPAARWPRGVLAEELLFLVDAVAGRPQYAFVRMVASVREAGSRSETLDDLIAFASAFAWPLRAVVTEGSAATGTVAASGPRPPGVGRGARAGAGRPAAQSLRTPEGLRGRIDPAAEIPAAPRTRATQHGTWWKNGWPFPELLEFCDRLW